MGPYFLLNYYCLLNEQTLTNMRVPNNGDNAEKCHFRRFLEGREIGTTWSKK